MKVELIRNLLDDNNTIIVGKNDENPIVTTPSTYVSMKIVNLITSSGHILLIVRIYPNHKKKQEEINIEVPDLSNSIMNRRSNSILNEIMIRHKTGWLTTPVWMKIIDYLITILKSWSRNEKSLIILDRLLMHTERDSIKRMMNHNIYPVYLPPHSSNTLHNL